MLRSKSNECFTKPSQGVCGNGIVDDGEECDQGEDNHRDESAVDGSYNSELVTCRSNCQLARCGDGIRDIEEACDDGNHVDEPCEQGIYDQRLGIMNKFLNQIMHLKVCQIFERFHEFCHLPAKIFFSVYFIFWLQDLWQKNFLLDVP